MPSLTYFKGRITLDTLHYFDAITIPVIEDTDELALDCETVDNYIDRWLSLQHAIALEELN